MPIEFNCPSCFKGYRVADSNAGKRVKCKDCGATMTVPDMSGLSLADEDTGLHKRPAKRHSSTKILPANRPGKGAGAKSSARADAAPKRNVPSDTVKLTSGVKITRPPQAEEPELPAKLPPGKLPGGLRSPADLPKLKSAAGRARLMPEAPKKRMPNIVLMLGSAAMVTGFFLPWFTPAVEGFGALAGFMLPLKANDLVAALHAAATFGDNAVVNAMHEDKTAMFAWFTLYLLPLLALFAVIDDLRCAGKGKSHWWIRMLAAVAPLLVAAAIYFAFRPAFDDFMGAGGLQVDLSATLAAVGPGAYTTAGGWLLMLLAILIAPKVKKPRQAAPAKPDAQEDEDVPDVSSQTTHKTAGAAPVTTRLNDQD